MLGFSKRGCTAKCSPHPIPGNWAFVRKGKVYEGGKCPACGRLVKGRFLGDVDSDAGERLHEVPDYTQALDTLEGKAAHEKLMAALDVAQNNSDRYRAWHAYDQTMTQVAERFPKVNLRIVVAEGRSIRRFEKEGYIVTRLDKTKKRPL